MITNPLTAYLNDLLVDGNTLFIDNSRLETFTQCPRLGQYTILQKRIPSDEKAALTFGKHIHTAMEYRYKFFGTRKLNELEKKKLFHLLDLCFALSPVPEDDHRQAGFAQMLMDMYLRDYPEEQFQIMEVDGKPMVEQSFAVELGYVGNIKIVWTGRIDLAVLFDDRLVIIDHKTASMGGEGYFSEFYTSNALKGYAFATSKVTNKPCNTAMINSLLTRKNTAKGKGPEVARSSFINFSEDTLFEWRENVLCIVEDFLSNVHRGFFPMHTKQCVAKFGRCPMFDVCQLPPDSRYAMLNSPLYSEDKWNPLHTNDIDLTDFHNKPFDPNSIGAPERKLGKVTTQNYDISDLLA